MVYGDGLENHWVSKAPEVRILSLPPLNDMNNTQLKRKLKDIMENGWCSSEEIVDDDKKHRCSVCGRRLKPRETDEFTYYGNVFRLPPHKKKGYKIKRKKGHNKRERKGMERKGKM